MRKKRPALRKNTLFTSTRYIDNYKTIDFAHDISQEAVLYKSISVTFTTIKYRTT